MTSILGTTRTYPEFTIHTQIVLGVAILEYIKFDDDRPMIYLGVGCPPPFPDGDMINIPATVVVEAEKFIIISSSANMNIMPTSDGNLIRTLLEIRHSCYIKDTKNGYRGEDNRNIVIDGMNYSTIPDEYYDDILYNFIKDTKTIFPAGTTFTMSFKKDMPTVVEVNTDDMSDVTVYIKQLCEMIFVDAVPVFRKFAFDLREGYVRKYLSEPKELGVGESLTLSAGELEDYRLQGISSEYLSELIIPKAAAK